MDFTQWILLGWPHPIDFTQWILLGWSHSVDFTQLVASSGFYLVSLTWLISLIVDSTWWIQLGWTHLVDFTWLVSLGCLRWGTKWDEPDGAAGWTMLDSHKYNVNVCANDDQSQRWWIIGRLSVCNFQVRDGVPLDGDAVKLVHSDG